MKKGFTLVEMLVVLGIIAALTSASIAAFGKIRATADRAKAQELVSQVATALTQLYNKNGSWPKLIREGSEGTGVLNERVSYVLATRDLLSLTYDANTKKTTGNDRFGVVTPWAMDVIKRSGKNASLGTVVSTDYNGQSHTIEDHILHFKVDLDGDGVIEGVLNGQNVRAIAAVWCAGKDGLLETSYSDGLKRDDVYSWTPGQTRNVK